MGNGASTIHQYATAGDLPGITVELGKGVLIDAINPENNRTVLMEAVASPVANLDLINLLIKSGADVNAIATDKINPAMAMWNETLAWFSTGHPDIDSDPTIAGTREKLRAIMQQQPELPVGKESVLSLAINGGDLEIVKALLDAGADIRYQRPSGYTALIDVVHCRIAQEPELVPLMQLLISRGAELNGTTKYAESALRVTSNRGRFDCVRLLLDAGADPSHLQWTPLMTSIALGSVDDVAILLNDHPDLAARDFWSRTPWLLSLQIGDVAKAELLLAAGADRSDRGRCGKTPLMYPIVNGHTAMLRWLLSQDLTLMM